MSACRSLLFDLDGTLIDSGTDIASAANEALSDIGRARLPEAAVRSFVGDGARNLMLRCLGGDASLLGPALAAFEAAYQRVALEHTRLFPGIRPLLDELAGLPMAVISNKPEPFCRQILGGLGVADRFALVAGGETFDERKPSPIPFLAALERIGAPAGGAIVVGDGPQDIRGARAAGLRSCAASWGFTARDVLEREGPTWFAPTVNDLRELLARLRRGA
jgi:phosphoglycolate phosphatase